MNKYIYGLFDGDLCLYVGQTKNLQRRMKEHKNKKNGTGSGDIPEYNDVNMRILEKVLPEEKISVKEAQWYDILKPFYNKIRPGEAPSAWIKQKNDRRERNLQLYRENCRSRTPPLKL